MSTDYVNDPRSGIVDAACTQVIDRTMVKIYAWCVRVCVCVCKCVCVCGVCWQRKVCMGDRRECVFGSPTQEVSQSVADRGSM